MRTRTCRAGQRKRNGGTTRTTARAYSSIDLRTLFCGASTIEEAIVDDFAAAIEMYHSKHLNFPVGHTSCFYGTFVSAINIARIVLAADLMAMMA